MLTLTQYKFSTIIDSEALPAESRSPTPPSSPRYSLATPSSHGDASEVAVQHHRHGHQQKERGTSSTTAGGTQLAGDNVSDSRSIDSGGKTASRKSIGYISLSQQMLARFAQQMPAMKRSFESVLDPDATGLMSAPPVVPQQLQPHIARCDYFSSPSLEGSPKKQQRPQRGMFFGGSNTNIHVQPATPPSRKSPTNLAGNSNKVVKKKLSRVCAADPVSSPPPNPVTVSKRAESPPKTVPLKRKVTLEHLHKDSSQIKFSEESWEI